MRKIFILISILFVSRVYSQAPNDILNLLIANKTITQDQADSIRADAAIRQQEADANKKSFLVSAARQIQINGYSQLRYQILDEAGKKNGFDIRRARIDLKGNVTPFFGIRFQTEFADKTKILDAYAEIKISSYFNITAGQFKIPFSLENLTSSNKLELIDRSQVVEALAARGKDVTGNNNGRDIGIQAGGTLLKSKGSALVEYRLGIFNGSGINVGDTANEAKDIAGRLIINPVKGLSFGAGYYNGWDRAIKPDVRGKSQARNRFGLEAAYTAERLSVRGEFIKGRDGKTERQGWYLQAGYFLVPLKLQVVGKYDSYDPNITATNNRSAYYVAGANYNFNTWSRIQAFYTFREEEGARVNNNYFSMQYQIGF